ncbi:MAG: hypothetical protein LBJ20_04330 [Candidatus Methanoplasma sp.]|nr:hypothetical protein [Candidatus Methanoplasma sp.]
MKVAETFGKLKDSKILSIGRGGKPSDRIEKVHKSRLLILLIVAIIGFVALIGLILTAAGRLPDVWALLQGVMSSVLALLFAVIILDNISAHSEKKKKRREERNAIIRHNKIIQPVIDMYIVRKNMVITPNDRKVRKFKIDAEFTIKDMKDMFGPSELISDVEKSKIEVYAFYQEKLHDKFTHLVEDVDFNAYSDLCNAAMDYINATSYGASALGAVMGYQRTMAGTKSMKSIVVNMIRDESEGGKFIDAPPALKNVYLVHQMINDQEKALARYLGTVQGMLEEDSKERDRAVSSEIDYE